MPSHLPRFVSACHPIGKLAEQSWSYDAGSETITVTMTGGQDCGSTPRRAVVQVVCGLNQPTAIVWFDGERPLCNYHFTIGHVRS